MKRWIALLLALVLVLSLAACGSKTDDASDSADTDEPAATESGTQESSDSETSSAAGQETVTTDDGASGEETTAADDTAEAVDVPNNGEWDEILCSGDGYHLVKKEVDAYDGYKFTLGVVDDEGQWVQELTDTGTFMDEVRFRAEGSSETLQDSTCYYYLGEGVFLASPGVTVYTKDEEFRVGPWENNVSYSPTGRAEVSIWECLVWNVVDNSQAKFDASKISVFQDGYLLFCEEDDMGKGTLNAMNTKCEITELPCKYLPNNPMHNFPVYSEGLFFASTEDSDPGFFDIQGNLVIDLSEYDMGRVPYSSELGVNAPYFENGQATILMANNADSVFRGTIDKTGKLLGEPEKTDIPVF